MSLALYPASPVEKHEPRISDNFRKQAWIVIFSLLAFFVVFIALLAAVVSFALLLIYLAMALLMAKPTFLTLVATIGLVVTGISLVVFVVKFIFSKNETDHSGMVELTKHDQPMLFAFLEKLTDEVGSPRPHKVYLSPDVNAAVFADSRFINMIVPAKKNLLIGAGLVNAINISEFKAIMAHEFGHFSQKSTRIGGFIYSVNRVIHNMLFDNDSYVNFLRTWGNFHWLLGLFATVTVKISQFIQWILRHMYVLVNKNYMGLSREMEYNADDIAAIAAGGNNLYSGLQKFMPAHQAYQRTIENANELIDTTRIVNLYHAQTATLKSTRTMKIASRVNYQDQWASHPSQEERKQNLDKTAMFCEADERTAWSLFKNAEKIQEQMTDELYTSVQFENEPAPMDANQYEIWVRETNAVMENPKEYHGYYDGRVVSITEEQYEMAKKKTTDKTFADIFNSESGLIQLKIDAYQEDLELVKAIGSRMVNTKTFDFDGKKYASSNTEEVCEMLNADISRLRTRQEYLDQLAITYFYQHSADKHALEAAFYSYFQKKELVSKYTPKTLEAIEAFQLVQQGVTLDKAEEIAALLKDVDENFLKKVFIEIPAEKFIAKNTRSRLEEFQSKSYAYFSGNSFMENELAECSALVYLLDAELKTQSLAAFKKILELQIQNQS